MLVRGIKNEFVKNKRTGLIPVTVISLILIISFQGTLGYISNYVDGTNIYITSLGTYFRLFLPIIITLFVSISLYNERRNEGVLLYYFNALSIRQMFYYKWTALSIQVVITYFSCAILALVFVTMEGESLWQYVINHFPGFIYSIIAVLIVLNVQLLLSMIFNNALIAIAIALIASIGNFFVPSTSLWVWSPWSYPYRMLYYESVHVSVIIGIAVFLVITSIALGLLQKRFATIMLH